MFEVDWARMDERARGLTLEVASGRAMRFIDGRCAALERDAGDDRTRCAIHEQRPDCCRWLVPDSGACREQQRTKGHRTLELARPAR